MEVGAGPLVCPGIEGMTSSPGFEMGNQGGAMSSGPRIFQQGRHNEGRPSGTSGN